MAAHVEDGTKWKHLRGSMSDLQDHLRCWTCNQVFINPIRYNCGHFFCEQCAKVAGTYCATCNIPSLASEVKSDRIITAITGCFHKLSHLLTTESKKTPDKAGSSKLSRSTVYDYDGSSKNASTKSGSDIQNEFLSSGKKDDQEKIPDTVNIGSNEDQEDAVSTTIQDSKVQSLEIQTDDDFFVKPLRVRRSSLKDKQRVASALVKNDTVTLKPKNIATATLTVDDVAAAKGKKVGRPRGRPPKKRTSSDSLVSETKSKLDESDVKSIDVYCTPKKAKQSKKLAIQFPSTSVKSTPRKSTTPGREKSKKNHKGETPLHVACIKGTVSKVHSLLKTGATPNTKDNAGWTPLHEAAIHGFTDIVELLLNFGALVDVPGAENVTPLHEAVSNNHLPIVKMLVAHGADIHARSSKGETPMDLVGSDEVKEALINTKQGDLSSKADSGIQKAKLTEQEMVLYGDPSLIDEEKNQLAKIADIFNAGLVSEFRPGVTHFVALSDDKQTCSPSMDILCAILQGVTILTKDWLKIAEDVQNIDLGVFELLGVTDFADAEAPKLSRLNAEKQLPGLFNGCHFFVRSTAHYKMPNCTLSRANIINLIKAGGGSILSREPHPEAIPVSEHTVPYHAPRDSLLSVTSHYILYSPGKGEQMIQYNMKHCKTLSVEWFIHCIFNWKLIDP